VKNYIKYLLVVEEEKERIIRAEQTIELEEQRVVEVEQMVEMEELAVTVEEL